MEESTLPSQENSPKEQQKTPLKLTSRNNAIPEWNNVVSDVNVLAYYQRSNISQRMLQTDSPMDGNLPPVKNQSRKWISQPSLATPCNPAQPPAETALNL